MEESVVDQATGVARTSWLKRLGQAVVGVVIGLVAIVASVVVLFWNEGRAIKTAQGLSEGASILRSVASEHVDPANEGRLIHVTGPLTTGAPVADSDFAVRSRGVRLVRQVEMYQWREESQFDGRSAPGGGDERRTTYQYVRGWSDRPVDSTGFKEPRGHTNPLMVFPPRDIVAPGTRLGAFAVPEPLLRSFGAPTPLAVTDIQATALQIRVNKPASIVDGLLYVGRDAAQPAIGDLRVAFSEVPLQTASIVAAQSGDGFAPFPTRTGRAVELMAAGAVPAANMFKEAEQENATLVSILRVVGVIVMFVGFSLILRRLGVAADVIPWLGSILRVGSGLAAIVCTLALATIVIAMGWLWVRPLTGVAVLAGGAVATYALMRLVRLRATRKARPA
ncbi:hypothetical protein BH11PSE3_BH11PSE3_45400 [soil metagenome]